MRETWKNRLFPLKENPEGLRFSQSNKRFEVVVAGRRCLEKGTLVATPTGPRPIESLKIGDIVIGFDGDNPELTTVENVFYNGIQTVTPLESSHKKYVAATDNHKLWACNESLFDKRKPHLAGNANTRYDRRKVVDLTRRFRVKRQYLYDYFTGGEKSIKNTYSLGAMIGNGCCLQGNTRTGAQTKYLYISDADGTVARAVAAELGGYAEKLHADNYTWKIGGIKDVLSAIPFYRDWCCMRYSHQKIVNLREIDSWDKSSCMAFLAGMIDTDGSIFYKNKSKKEIVIQIGMQAKTAIEACQFIIRKYFQENLVIYEDSRAKYKNGSVWSVKSSSNILALNMISALSPYLKRRIGFDLSSIEIRNILPDRIGLKKGESYQADTYDITVANDTNLYFLHDGGIVTSNSGKSERAKRKFILRVLAGSKYPRPRYIAAAPTHGQAHKIYFNDFKDMIPPFLIDSINKSESSIMLKTGQEILVFGLDNPARVEGAPIDGMIIDETDDLKANTLEAHVYPCFTDRQAWCMFLGVPNGMGLLYNLSKNALIEPEDWDFYTWPSSEVLPKKDLDRFKKIYDARFFQQEFEASFLNFTGRVYYAFERENYKHELYYNPNKPLIFMFDFNVSPGIAVVGQEQQLPGQYEEVLHNGVWLKQPVIGTGVIGEVWIPQNSNTLIVCQRLYNDWKHHKGEIICYGDAAGGNKTASAVSGSDWDLIKAFFKNTEFANRISYKYPRANPPIKKRINSMNSRFCSVTGVRRMMVDAVAAPKLIEDLEQLSLLEGGSGEIDEKKNKMIGHESSALGYYVTEEFPVDSSNSVQTYDL